MENDNQETYSQNKNSWVEENVENIKDEEQRDQLLDKELASLIEERDAILNGTSEDYLCQLAPLENERKRKLERAMDFYQLQLQYAGQLYELAKKEAYDSFQALKAEQRDYMWRIKLEREITLRLLRLSIPLRDQNGQVVVGNFGMEGFVNLIYRNRSFDKSYSYPKRRKLQFIREQLKPDETNYDLEMIIRGLEELQQIASSQPVSTKSATQD
ncbi:hypothetical protein Gasu2_50540 [Galdieria sulphuraria]|uniref:Uncharacterized protein n=1 Tax=Galdieria sulphuraria TaxID=130081 RepID=M2XLI3_GALSU|nr:hypothetical protein Gasu_17960 isoform 1 [Galdieria sulphuraria]EME31037.1 hypothetical protein Gasu_17960 isoform 1 [Galdieria sulphuraria]GJD10887.1 hypothetical protein Gasu2_50540 [Galdieria sulphuraria]|eukprot:XP_005707557.1 hypothetical protein isoform 1 [Galdieria sulphuraria]